jgi:LL-H family phage holin
MSTTTITNIILAALPFLATVAYLLARIIEQKLPSNLQIALDQFATNAVQAVEQQYAGKLGSDKKQLAIQAVESLLRTFHLPDPGATAISASIESAVFLMNQSKTQVLEPVAQATTPSSWLATAAKQPQPIVLPATKPDAPQVL